MCLYLYVALGVVITCIAYFIIRRMFDAIYIKDVHKKYVLITGCDTGFGYAAARKFDKLGSFVIAGCYTDKGKSRVIGDCSSRLFALKLDVCSDASVKEFASQVQNYIPDSEGLWGIVNNAGAFGPLGPLEWYTPQDFLDTVNLNVGGMVRVTHALLPLFKRGGGGRIVNTASVLGFVTFPYGAAYSATKHAVVAYSHALRRELWHFGISVHIIAPGGHKTEFFALDAIKQRVRQAFDSSTPALQQQYGREFVDQLLWGCTDLTYGVATDSPDGVVDAYEKALFSKYPRLHYVVGMDSLLYLGLAYLPDQVFDWLLKLPIIAPVPASRR